MRRLLPGRRGTVRYVLADALALVAFVVIGIRGHRGSTVEGFLRTAAPLLGAWFLVAWAGHTYHRPGWRSLLRNWIIAVPVGLLGQNGDRGLAPRREDPRVRRRGTRLQSLVPRPGASPRTAPVARAVSPGGN